MGSLRWRAVLAAFVIVVALIYILPSIPSVRTSFLGKLLPSDEISLGLDLKGGIHLTLGVDLETAMANAVTSAGQDLRAEARDKKIMVLRPKLLGTNQLEFILLKAEQRQELEDLLKKRFGSMGVTSSTEAGNGQLRYVLTATDEHVKYVENLTMDQALKTIRNRIDQFGVAEPDIRKQLGNRIIVQLPGLDDPKRAISIIGRTAHLEFRLVDETADVQAALAGKVPPESELAYLFSKKNAAETQTPIVLKSEVVLTGEYITDANVQFDSYGQAYVGMNFNARGARIFEDVTGANVKKRLAIVLDGKVHSAPVIQDRIAGGRASITGQFTTEEAHDLAVVLRAGSLPAPVTILEERSVGPSLGQESIDKGMFAAFIGGLAVIIFMSIYYRRAGLIASFEIVLDIILILAGLAAFGATLTLPGIAGIILTLGMAVDANVLIYERIREELRRGESVSNAITNGFSRATMTIVDSNLTTIIAAVILYQFGTGPVRGFAVTLTLGILASMFTAIFVSRIFFDAWLERRQPGTQPSI
ncbi:MAG: protein translocase subunit SecD [Desulfovibrionales bacterium]|nr:protein translocase subunit SecD [Desulfovibrionales bacterium]